VLDVDISGFFDSIDWELMLRVVRHHTDCRWALLYIERWLKAPVQIKDGSIVPRVAGTPQGGVISPLLANLFLHYAFCVDGADVRAHPVRALRRRYYLSLQERRGGASTLPRDCRPLYGLQVGAASTEDKGRLLQGCEPAGRLSQYPLRLSRLPVSSSEDHVGEGGQTHLRAQFPARRQPEGVEAHRPRNSKLGAPSPQRQIPDRPGPDVQSVHPRLDQLLQPLQQDAVASDPKADRCLCHSVGAAQVQADAPPDQRRWRLV
jgi:hypothetical protein